MKNHSPHLAILGTQHNTILFTRCGHHTSRGNSSSNSRARFIFLREVHNLLTSPSINSSRRFIINQKEVQP